MIATPAQAETAVDQSDVVLFLIDARAGVTPTDREFAGRVRRRGKPVKKMRLIPAEKAFAIARKLQGTRGCTVSVC